MMGARTMRAFGRATAAEQAERGYQVVIAQGWDRTLDEFSGEGRCVEGGSGLTLPEAILLAMQVEREQRAERSGLRTYVTDAVGCLIDTDH